MVGHGSFEVFLVKDPWMFSILLFQNSPWDSVGRTLSVACPTTAKHEIFYMSK